MTPAPPDEPKELSLDAIAQEYSDKLDHWREITYPEVFKDGYIAGHTAATAHAQALLAEKEKTIQLMRAVVEAARDAIAQIKDQKGSWPGEVDTLDDALRALDEQSLHTSEPNDGQPCL